ncbi:MAG: hypothetical protein FWH50_03015 [Coriobacteriia bacterium]|nr:hypothetical protein [Coriobacteriia bacterium]
MKFRQRVSTPVSALATVLVMLLGWAAQSAYAAGRWVWLGVSLALMLLPIALTLGQALRISYIFQPDCLEVRGLSGFRMVRASIAYDHMLDVLVTGSVPGDKTIDVLYWDGSCFSDLDIRLPGEEERFLEQLRVRRRPLDYSLIIASDFVAWSASEVKVPIEACGAVTANRCDDGRFMALLDDGGRIVLLADCSFDLADGSLFVDYASEADLPREGIFVCCGLMQLHHLDYRSVEEALADVLPEEAGAGAAGAGVGAAIRRIDRLAMGD